MGFIAAGFTLILGAQILFTILLSAPNGIRIKSPEGVYTLDRTFVVSGDAWMKNGIAGIKVEAAPRAGVGSLVVAAVRDEVTYRGTPLFALSSWSARVELPSDGAWELRASVTGSDGASATSAMRQVRVQIGTAVREFRSWTLEHLIPIVIIALAAVGLGLLARTGKKTSRRGTEESLNAAFRGTPRSCSQPPSRFLPIALVLSAAMWINELLYQLYWFRVGGWSVASALMLQMCGLSILFLPVAFLSESGKSRQFLFDILYFWGIGGAMQALIAPDIGANGFPAYKYFSFFASHGLIITCATVLAMAGNVSITLRSFVRVFVVTNVLLIPMYGLDQLLALIPPYDPGNYFVLGYPPPTGSIVDLFSDLFGPSPRYVLGLELMGLVVFGILYLPWPIARLIRRGRQRRGLTAGEAS
jgi:hypothetical integral membrane protein (TIGR02206 family)